MAILKRVAKLMTVSLAVLFGAVLLGLSWPSSPMQAFSVQTGSMRPAINPGALVFVQRGPVENLKPGDVITFVDPANRQQTITHRLVRTEISPMGSPQLITKGDANDAADKPIDPDKVVGKVRASVPFVGKISNALKTPAGLLAAIYIPALIIIGYEIRRLTQYYRTQQSYRLADYRQIIRRRQLAKGPLALMLVLGASLAIMVPARAALRDSVTIAGTTIKTAPSEEPEEPPPTNCEVTNNNDVSVNNSTNQTATSGDATSSGNTNGGSATTGDATNNSNTSTNVTVDNDTECPASQP